MDESLNFDTAPDQMEGIDEIECEIECEVESDEDDQTARSSTINITEGERLHQTRHGSIQSTDTSVRVTDHTFIASVRWSSLKYSAMSLDYKLKPWYKYLDAQERELLETLRNTQKRAGKLRELKARDGLQ